MICAHIDYFAYWDIGQPCEQSPSAKIMHPIGLNLLLQTAILVVAFNASAQEVKSDGVAVPQRDLQAKIVYCKTCHGLSGEGFRGYSVMPRLAGQQIDYFEGQI